MTLNNDKRFLSAIAIQLTIILCITQLTWGDYNPDWENPDAFSQRKSLSSGKNLSPSEDGTCKCPAPGNTKDDYLSSLYRKLVKFLLRRDTMKVNLVIS